MQSHKYTLPLATGRKLPGSVWWGTSLHSSSRLPAHRKHNSIVTSAASKRLLNLRAVFGCVDACQLNKADVRHARFNTKHDRLSSISQSTPMGSAAFVTCCESVVDMRARALPCDGVCQVTILHTLLSHEGCRSSTAPYVIRGQCFHALLYGGHSVVSCPSASLPLRWSVRGIARLPRC